MGYKKQRFKNGVLIDTIDTRILSEEVEKKKKEINRYLGEYLSKTDWQLSRANDPSTIKSISDETVILRKKARDLAESLEMELDAAKHLDDLEKFNPKIEDLM